MQLASGAFACYLPVKYVTLKIKNIFFKSSKVKILSFDIKHIMFFGVTVQEVD